MPRTEVMLIGALPAQSGFPGAGGPIPPSHRAPYPQPDFRMNRHMVIPSTWQEPQNLLQVTDKTVYDRFARASTGKPITSALRGLNVKKAISPILFGLGAGETAESASGSQTIQAPTSVSAKSYDDAVFAANYWYSTSLSLAISYTVLGATMAGLHGYRRNKGSVGYTALWSVLGGLFPILTNGAALIQGYAKPAGR